MINHIKYYIVFFLILISPFISFGDDSLNEVFSQILMKRYSGYQYDSSKFITREELNEILKAGILAPSASNEQPWNFIVCDKFTELNSFEKTLETLVPFNKNWAKNASAFIIIISSTQSLKTMSRNIWAEYDTGAAAFSMMLKATAMGYMAHQIGGFDPLKIRETFSIPENFQPLAIMAIGYPSSNERQPEKKRKPFNENIFIGTWGKNN